MPPREATLYPDLSLPALHTLPSGEGLVITDISDRSHSQIVAKVHVDQPPAPEEWRVEIRVYPRDVVVKQAGRYPSPAASGEPVENRAGKKQKIVCLSEKSRRSLIFNARNTVGLTHMLTLTYPLDFPHDGRIVKRHLACMRKWLVRRNISGMWILEFQERGAPHFHIWITGGVNKIELSQAWYDIVQSGDEKHLRAGTNVEKLRNQHAVSSYAAKYISKMAQKDVPEGYADVGRYWGLFGGLKPEPREVITGSLGRLAPVIRPARNLENAHRRKEANKRRKQGRKGLKKRKDRGRAGRTFFDAAAALTPRVLDALLPAAHFYRRTSRNPMPTDAETGNTSAPVVQHLDVDEEPPSIVNHNVIERYDLERKVCQGRGSDRFVRRPDW